MSVYIATGITHNYLARAEPYLASLRIHEPERATLFCVNFTPGQDVQMRMVPVEYVRCLQVDKFMLQHGAWTSFVPKEWSPTDVVIFTDADGIQQRPFTPQEIEHFNVVTRNGGVAMGRNRPEGFQSLADEAQCLFPRHSADVLARRFPGYDTIGCYNTGFVVARLQTWRSIYNEFRRVWPDMVDCFQHYARVQFGICWALQRPHPTPLFTIHELPLTYHTHGHLGLPNGVEKGADNVWRYNNQTIAFAHAL